MRARAFARTDECVFDGRYRESDAQTPKSRAHALWTKVRVVVLLNQLLSAVRRGERRPKMEAKDKLKIQFVGVSGADVRDEIRRVQAKFIQPARKNKILEKSLKKVVYTFLSDPQSSSYALGFQCLMFALIMISISSFIASTMPEHSGKASLDIIEMVCQLIFSVEYVVKISCAPKPLKAFKDPLNMVDLVSIVPWYVEICMSGLAFGYSGAQETNGTSSARVLRIFRLFRVIKVFRLGSRAKKIQVIVTAVSASADMFIVLGFLLVLGLVMFSALIYFCEKGKAGSGALEDNEIDNFDSIPRAFWWCMVTLMTVGYGDAVPVTTGGKFVSVLTMLGSVLITALPISVIGANFTQQWLEFKSKEERKVTRMNIKGKSRNLIKEMQAYSQVITTLSDHVSSMENTIMQEISSLRVVLTAIVRMSKTVSRSELRIACQAFDNRFKRLEDLREELEDLQATYDLVSHAEFALALQQLKTVGVKMQKLEETGTLLNSETGALINSTATLRTELFALKENLAQAMAQQALDQELEESHFNEDV